ncbi:MAG TPA: hypothetical protein VJZ91_18695 [Blastocatellia bacterium]|nr:hypothetical protein [Blastocatellia bacterium]
MSDDPTKKLPKREGRYDTQPTIETVLERINTLGESLGGKIDKVRDDLGAEIETLRVGQEQLRVGQEHLRVGQEQLRVELGSEIQSLRSEMNQRFTFLDRKLGILTREVLDVKAREELAEDRIDKLEQKTS